MISIYGSNASISEIVKSKLVNINKEYVKAHVEVLKDIKPQVNND